MDDKNKNNIHDKSYKVLFSNKETFLNLIRTFVSSTWGNVLTKENLQLVDKSYVLSDYNEMESDIVYKAKLGEEEVFFYMLLEFQSSVDYSMPIRLLLYMIEIWREVLKNTTEKEFKRKSFKLPAIVSIVLYNGDRKWTVAKSLKEVISHSDIFEENILNFKYQFLDVNKYDKEELYEHKDMTSAIFLLDQNINTVEFYNRLKNIIISFNKLSEKEKLQLKQWLINVNTEGNEYKDNIEKLFNSNKEEVVEMTSNISKGLERLKKEGIKEGIKEGKERGIKEGSSEKAIDIAIKLLTKKFKELPLEIVSKIKVLPGEKAEAIATDIFDIDSLEDLEKYY